MSAAPRLAGWQAMAQQVGPVGGANRFYPKAYALVVGIDAYDGRDWGRLQNAVKDAEEVRDALARHGFEVTYLRDLASRDLKDALEEFFISKGSDRDAALFFWFAGHGTNVGSEGYIVPADAPSIQDDAGFRRTAVSMRTFGRLMREARSQHVMAVFDSCFSGTVFKTGRSGHPPAIRQAMEHAVRQYVSAGDHTQEVADDGLFRKLFVDAILGRDPNADGNRDGYVTGREIGIYMRNTLLNRSDGRQAPQFGELIEGDFDRGDFIFQVGPGGGGGQFQSAAYTPAVRDEQAPTRNWQDVRLRSTKVFVAPPVGAKGEGNRELREALARQLEQRGFEILTADHDYAFKVHAVVETRNAGLMFEKHAVAFKVFNRSNMMLGTTKYETEVITGSFNGSWGAAADAAAEQAAKRIVSYLAQPG